jgi:hypothetical protein
MNIIIRKKRSSIPSDFHQYHLKIIILTPQHSFVFLIKQAFISKPILVGFPVTLKTEIINPTNTANVTQCVKPDANESN